VGVLHLISPPRNPLMSLAAVCGVKILQTVRKLVATFVRPLEKLNFAIFRAPLAHRPRHSGSA
jgi:hypothetical protein